MPLSQTLEAIYYLFKGNADQGIPSSGYGIITDLPIADHTETNLVPPDARAVRVSSMAWSFDPSDNEGLFGSFSLPANYAPGTDIVVGVSWFKETLNVGNVKWQMIYCTSNPFRGTNFTEAITSDATANSPGVAYDTIATPVLTISGTGRTVGDNINYRITRLADDPEDTLPDEAVLISTYLTYEIDRVAARNRTPPFYT